MAREKAIDFCKAKEDETVLEGRVIMVQTNREVLGEEEAYMVVACNRRRVTIFESEVEPLPFGQSIAKLIGANISFVILSYDADTEAAIGSNRIAEEKRLNPIRVAVKNGKAMTAKIVKILDHGAYLSINGVNALMRNKDFSEDGTTVRDAGYREYQTIEVVYIRDSANGLILVKPTNVIKAEKRFDISTLERGQLVLGKVCSVFPERVYVNISKGIDVMCEYPTFVVELKQGEAVKMKILKVNKENNKVRGIIVDVINR